MVAENGTLGNNVNGIENAKNWQGQSRNEMGLRKTGH